VNSTSVRLYLIIVFCILSFSSLYSQCFKGNNAFKDGEFISYTVSYNWGPIWVDAGMVTFSALNETYQGKPAIHLKSTGKTFPSYDFFFKVVDYYDAWIDPVTFIAWDFRRTVYEGGYTLINTMHFNHSKQLVYSNTKTNNNPVRSDTLKQGPCAFDMLSSVYVARTFNFDGMKPGTLTPVSVMIDDSIYNIYIKFMGKEIVENKDGAKYHCIKFTAKMVEGTIFRGDEDVVVWVTDDENKIPIYIQAKILVGTVKAYLKEYKGLRNPMTSLVK